MGNCLTSPSHEPHHTLVHDTDDNSNSGRQHESSSTRSKSKRKKSSSEKKSVATTKTAIATKAVATTTAAAAIRTDKRTENEILVKNNSQSNNNTFNIQIMHQNQQQQHWDHSSLMAAQQHKQHHQPLQQPLQEPLPQQLHEQYHNKHQQQLQQQQLPPPPPPPPPRRPVSVKTLPEETESSTDIEEAAARGTPATMPLSPMSPGSSLEESSPSDDFKSQSNKNNNTVIIGFPEQHPLSPSIQILQPYTNSTVGEENRNPNGSTAVSDLTSATTTVIVGPITSDGSDKNDLSISNNIPWSTHNNNKPYYTMSVEELNRPEPSLALTNNTTYSNPALMRRNQRRRKLSPRHRIQHQQQHHPAGRALQGRLQRAKHMQHALQGSPSDAITHDSSSVPFLSRNSMMDHASSGDESQSSLSYSNNNNHFLHQNQFHRTFSSSKYSTVSNMSGDASTVSLTSVNNNDEVGVPLSNAIGASSTAVWAEIDVDDPVLCTCFSRIKRSNHNALNQAALSKSSLSTSPCLFIAVGTASGTVCVQEIFGDSHQDMNIVEMPPTQNSYKMTTSTTSSISGSSIQDDTECVIDFERRQTTRHHGSRNGCSRLGQSYKVEVQGKVRSVDFSTDGQYLAVGGDAGTCTLFRLRYCPSQDTSIVPCLESSNMGVDTKADSVFHADEKNREANNQHGRLAGLEQILVLQRIDRVYAVQFSPDNKYLAVGGFDGTVAIYLTADIFVSSQQKQSHRDVEGFLSTSHIQQPRSPHPILPIAEIPRDGLVLTLDWSPDGRYLAIGGSDKCCAIVNTEHTSWKVIKEIRRMTSILSVQWYPGSGRYLAIGSSDVAIVVGRDTFATLTEIDLRIPCSNSSPDNTTVEPILSSSTNTVGYSELDDEHELTSNERYINPTSDPMLTGFENKLSNNTAKSLTSLSKGSVKIKNGSHPNPGSYHSIVYRTNAVGWSPNGTYLVVCGSNHRCTVLESSNFTIVHEMIRSSNITSVSWGEHHYRPQHQHQICLPRQRYLAIGGEDNRVVVLKAGIDLLSTSAFHHNHPHGTVASQSSLSMMSDSSLATTTSSYFSNRGDWVFREDAFRDMEDIMEVPASPGTTDHHGDTKYSTGSGYLKPSNTKTTVMSTRQTNESVTKHKDYNSNGILVSSTAFIPDRPHHVDQQKEMITATTMDSTKSDGIGDRSDTTSISAGPLDPTNRHCNYGKNNCIIAVTFSKGSKTKSSTYFAYAALDGLVTVRLCCGSVHDSKGAKNHWNVNAEIQFPQAIQTLTFSNDPKNQYLALGGTDSNVYIADTTSNYAIIAKIVLTAPVTSVTFSKNNERLGAGSSDGTFALLNPKNHFEFSGEIEFVPTFHDNQSNQNFNDDQNDSPRSTSAAVTAVDWCSKNMAIGRADGTVTIFDAKQVVMEDVYTAVTKIVRKAHVHCLAFGVSSRFLAVGGADSFVGIYSAKGSWVLCHQVSMMALSPVTKRPPSNQNHNVFRFRKNNNINNLGSIDIISRCADYVTSVRWSPVGRYLACGCSNGSLKVIDTIFWADVDEAAEAVTSVTTTTSASTLNDTTSPVVNENLLRLRNALLSSLSFSQDGKYLAMAQSDNGTTVLNSSSNWTVAFRVEGWNATLNSTTNPQSKSKSLATQPATESSSSLSSSSSGAGENTGNKIGTVATTNILNEATSAKAESSLYDWPSDGVNESDDCNQCKMSTVTSATTALVANLLNSRGTTKSHNNAMISSTEQILSVKHGKYNYEYPEVSFSEDDYYYPPSHQQLQQHENLTLSVSSLLLHNSNISADLEDPENIGIEV